MAKSSIVPRKLVKSVLGLAQQTKTVDPEKMASRAMSAQGRTLPSLSTLADGESQASMEKIPSPLSAAQIKASGSARRKLTDEDVARSLSIPNPVAQHSSFAGLPPLGVMNNGLLTIRVPELEFYDRNPRRELNPKFEEIKASIRESGSATITFEVTKRPNENKYMVARGGNTRLLALKELWSETLDPKYEQVTCIFKEWNGDLKTMAAHWLENNLRGDMSFIDQANEIAEMRTEIELERGEPLTHRGFSDELTKLGIVISKTGMTYLLFMADRVSVMGDSAKFVNQFAVRKLQPLCNRIVSMGESGEFGVGLREEEVYEQIINPVFKIWAEQFELAELEEKEHPDVDEFEKLLIKQITKTQELESSKVKALLNPEKQVKHQNQSPHRVGEVDANENNLPGHTVTTERMIPNNSHDDTVPERAQRSNPVSHHEEILPPQPYENFTQTDQNSSIDSDLMQCSLNVNENDLSGHTVTTERMVLNNSSLIGVSQLAKAFGLDEFLITSESLPKGFIVDIPDFYLGDVSDETIDDTRHAFWFLAAFSQQLSLNVEILPESKWRSLRENEQEAFEIYCCANLGAAAFEDGHLLIPMPALVAWMSKHNQLVNQVLGGAL